MGFSVSFLFLSVSWNGPGTHLFPWPITTLITSLGFQIVPYSSWAVGQRLSESLFIWEKQMTMLIFPEGRKAATWPVSSMSRAWIGEAPSASLLSLSWLSISSPDGTTPLHTTRFFPHHTTSRWSWSSVVVTFHKRIHELWISKHWTFPRGNARLHFCAFLVTFLPINQYIIFFLFPFVR